MKRSVSRLLVAPVVGLALLASACGSDDKSSTSDTTSAPTTTEASTTPITVKTSQIAIVQTQLDEVGCWAGPIDNVPTVLVLSGAREIGRVSGYVGPENFFHALDRLLAGAE